MCSRFLYLRAGGSGDGYKQCNMQVKDISIGWAMKQPDASAALDRVFANIRSLSDKSRTWLDAESETFTALCGTEGDRFTRRDVVKAHMYMVVLVAVMCVAGWLEGGAV